MATSIPFTGPMMNTWQSPPAGFQWANGSVAGSGGMTYQPGRIPTSGVPSGGTPTSGGGGFGNWLRNNTGILGVGASLIGSLFGNRGQQQNANQARGDALNRQGQIDAWTQQFMQPQQSVGAQWLDQLMTQMRGQGGPAQFSNTPIGYSDVVASTVDTTRFDPRTGGGTQLPSWIQTELRNADPVTAALSSVTNATGTMNNVRMGDRYLDFERLTNPSQISGAGFNRSQDALMQLVQGNGGYNSITAQLDPTNGMNLNEIVQGNTRFDMTPMFDALAPMEERTQSRALLDLNAQAGSLGSRMGTAMADRSANLLTRLAEEANLRRQNLAFQSSEAAQNRRLQASDLINARDNMFNQVQMADQGASVNATGNRIQGAGVASRNAVDELAARIQGAGSYNNAISALLGNAMDSQTRLALGNQSTGADISMFNAGAANTSSIQNAAQQNNVALANAANFLTSQGQNLQQGLARNNFNMQGAELSAQDLQRLASIMQSNASQTNSVNMGNANNRLSADTSNAGNALSAFLANQTAGQNYFNNQLSGYTTMMNDSNAGLNRMLQALGLRANVALPTASAGVGNVGLGNTMGDIGSLLMMMQYMNRGNNSGGNTARG